MLATVRVSRQNGVPVPIARWWNLVATGVRATAPRSMIASVATLALVTVIAVSPSAGGVRVSALFDSLTAPGETGFVAGHRGDKDEAPENTLPAFQLAVDSSVPFVETDLQLTSDGVPILMHDWTVERTTDGTGPVWNLSYAQLSRLDAGSWFSPEFAETRVPTLEQLLSLLQPTTTTAILELKGAWNQAQVRNISDLLYAYGARDRVIIASFDVLTLRAMQLVAPEVARVVIAREVVGDPAVLAEAVGAIAIVTSVNFIRRDPDAVQRIHDAGLGVLLYTLNNTDAWADAVALGVDILITDKPVKLDSWLARGASGSG